MEHLCFNLLRFGCPLALSVAALFVVLHTGLLLKFLFNPFSWCITLTSSLLQKGKCPQERLLTPLWEGEEPGAKRGPEDVPGTVLRSGSLTAVWAVCLDLSCGLTEPGAAPWTLGADGWQGSWAGSCSAGRGAGPVLGSLSCHCQCFTTSFSHPNTKAVPHVSNCARPVSMEDRSDKITRKLVTLPTWNSLCLW